MTLHHAAELGLAGVVFMIKAVGWCLREMVGSALGEALGELVKALYRRLRPPGLTGFEGLERKADARGRALWAEVLAEARARTPERPDPDPHVLKLSRIPTP